MRCTEVREYTKIRIKDIKKKGRENGECYK